MNELAAAFYCVADERYFLGAVGLVNSLRLVGHREPIFVLDCGLSADQRELLALETTIVAAGGDTPPWLLKTVAPLRHPAEAMVLIDADMIVTRRLDEPIERAGSGRLAAVEHGSQRFLSSWGELLDLGSARRGPYVSTSLIAVGRDLGREILGLMDRLQDRVDFDQTFWRQNVPDYPFLYGDQDVFNAILATRADPGAIEILPRHLEAIPPFAGLQVIDEATLRCAYEDGAEPYVLHHFSAKPWLERTPEGPYSRLLRRLLLGPDAPVAVPEHRLPRHLRRGVIGTALRSAASGHGRWRSYVAGPLSAGVRALRGARGGK
jgi:hypothetical protein